MAIIQKPSLAALWAQTGAKIKPDDNKIRQGWIVEIPPSENENWVQNRQDVMLSHINQAGICIWDAETVYTAGKSYVQATDGNIYVAQADNQNNNPLTTTAWLMVLRNDIAPVYQSRTIFTTNGIQGGGTLANDRTLSLVPTGVSPGTYGSAQSVSRLTIDQYGRVVAAQNQAIDFSQYVRTDVGVGNVGSFMLAAPLDDVPVGSLISGSRIRDVRIRQEYVDAAGSGTTNDMALKAYKEGSGWPGTWRNVGAYIGAGGGSNQYFDIGLFQRIS